MILAVLSAPNSTSIPLIMIEVFYPIFDRMNYQDPSNSNFTTLPSAKDRGLLYVSLTSILSHFWRWSVTYNLIGPENNNKRTQTTNSPLNAELLEKDLEKKEINPRDKNFKEIILEIINLPIIVGIFSLLICLNSNVRNLFIENGSILNNTLFNAHRNIAGSFTFFVLFALGNNIESTVFSNSNSKVLHKKCSEDNQTKPNYRKYLILSILKLVLTPLIGTPLILLFKKFNLVLDPVLLYILLIPLASPIAINLVVICNYKMVWEEFISILILFNYSIGIITVTISNTIFLCILS
jgi:predicted permease